jgi:hypothetical protein
VYNKINLKALTEFNTWRDHKHGKRFSQSGINNHNAALNKVLDEAELNGWITKAMRPTLLNKRKESRRVVFLDNFTRVHEQNPIGHLTGESHLVGDTNHRHAFLSQGHHDV